MQTPLLFNAILKVANVLPLFFPVGIQISFELRIAFSPGDLALRPSDEAARVTGCGCTYSQTAAVLV